MSRIFLFSVLVSAILFLVGAGSVAASSVTISKTGVVVVYRSVVLGDEDERQEEKNEEKTEESREEKKPEEKMMESEKKIMEVKREGLKVEMSNDGVPKIEIKQERKENKAKVESLQKNREILIRKLEEDTEAGILTESQREAMKQRIEEEKKKEENLRELKIDEVEDDELEVEVEDGVRLESVDDELEIEDEGERVRTSLPLVVDVKTRRVKVKLKETGEEVEVEKLSDVAGDLRGRGLIDDLSETKEGTPESELKTNEAGELVYDISGTKTEKMFGLFGVNVDKMVRVSAQTGEVLEVKQTVLSRLFDLLSF